MKKQYISAKGMKDLKQELNYLMENERPEIIKQIATAREFGDLSENAEYNAAKERQLFIERRIWELQQKIATLEVISQDKISNKDEVRFGAIIELHDKRKGQIVQYKIAGEDETGRNESIRLISTKSPIGRSLLGKKVGEVVKVHAPIGIIEYEIKKIEYR
ncbi:MAG: transcription elongation factor GreA [Candidatus Cloacimonadota bacterium]|nr:MAG: transcription elongation factor GreA [Candidatus Cloacimonadota bacterium]